MTSNDLKIYFWHQKSYKSLWERIWDKRKEFFIPFGQKVPIFGWLPQLLELLAPLEWGGPGSFLYIFWTVRAWSTILDRWLFLKGPYAHFFHPLFRKYPYFSTLEAPNAPRAWPKPLTINSQNDRQLLGFLKRYYTPGLLSPEKSSIFIEFPYAWLIWIINLLPSRSMSKYSGQMDGPCLIHIQR